jgi:hypothetical protein
MMKKEKLFINGSKAFQKALESLESLDERNSYDPDAALIKKFRELDQFKASSMSRGIKKVYR